MKPRELLDILSLVEGLKDTTRHSYTSKGRHESVAEHSWRMALMAYFLTDEFPQVNMDKVIKMCLIHDLGELFTGDIPSFEKNKHDEEVEDDLLLSWLQSLPAPYAQELLSMYEEMKARKTLESQIYKAIDSLEVIIQHNEADLSTWIPLEYELNKTYADDKVAFSTYLTKLRQLIREDTIKKLKE